MKDIPKDLDPGRQGATVTKSEKSKLRKAMDMLWDGGDRYNEGLAIIARMVGRRYHAGEIRELRRISIKDMAALSDNCKFRVEEQKSGGKNNGV